MKEDFFDHNIDIKEYITGNRFIDICDKTGATFCKTDNINEYANTKQNIFVTHNSDYHVDSTRFNLRPSGNKKWFAQNKDFEHEDLISIPIGLENMTKRFSKASQLGRFSSQPVNGLKKALHINKLAKKKLDHENLIYLNINPNTFLQERSYVLQNFKNKEWVTHKSNITWQEYYSDIASHKFVLSPRGNGVDCHRTWESLYLRTIPIVRTSICMNDFSDLPILFIDNWQEISYDYLNEKYKEISSKSYNLDKMRLSYWKDYIEEAHAGNQ